MKETVPDLHTTVADQRNTNCHLQISKSLIDVPRNYISYDMLILMLKMESHVVVSTAVATV